MITNREIKKPYCKRWLFNIFLYMTHLDIVSELCWSARKINYYSVCFRDELCWNVNLWFLPVYFQRDKFNGTALHWERNGTRICGENYWFGRRQRWRVTISNARSDPTGNRHFATSDGTSVYKYVHRLYRCLIYGWKRWLNDQV